MTMPEVRKPSCTPHLLCHAPQRGFSIYPGKSTQSIYSIFIRLDDSSHGCGTEVRMGGEDWDHLVIISKLLRESGGTLGAGDGTSRLI